jgi:hypothetical protein
MPLLGAHQSIACGPLLNDPRFARLPMVLETGRGDDLAGDVENPRRLHVLIS